MFAYPPHFALAYAPLAELPFRASYVVHTLLMAAALTLALRLQGVKIFDLAGGNNLASGIECAVVATDAPGNRRDAAARQHDDQKSHNNRKQRTAGVPFQAPRGQHRRQNAIYGISYFAIIREWICIIPAWRSVLRQSRSPCRE